MKDREDRKKAKYKMRGTNKECLLRWWEQGQGEKRGIGSRSSGYKGMERAR